VACYNLSAEEFIHLGRIWAVADGWRVECHALATQMMAHPDEAGDLMSDMNHATHTWMSLLSVMLTNYVKADLRVAAIDGLMSADDARRLKRIITISNEDEWLQELPSIYDWSLVIHAALGDAVREANDHAGTHYER
jgi:hypothetical protein